MFSVMDNDPINSLKVIFRWIRKDNFCSQFGLEMHLQVLLCLAITTLKCVAGIGTYMHVFDVKQKLLLSSSRLLLQYLNHSREIMNYVSY